MNPDKINAIATMDHHARLAGLPTWSELNAQVQQPSESPCACWPGRMCSRQSQCAADVKQAVQYITKPEN